MITANSDTLRAILALDAANPGAFRVFRKWISDSWITQLTASDKMEKEVYLRWLQGRCQELEDIDRVMTNAQEDLNKLTQAKEVSTSPEPNHFD